MLEKLQSVFNRAKTDSPFYSKKLKDMTFETMEDFWKIPFSDKAELREAYPLGLMSVPKRDVVRVHSSSGTTGSPVIIPYTRKDVEDWAILFARCYETAGITADDVIQITPGYGLWTAGIGFQAGAERLGALALPMGPGNTEKQLQMMQDMESTVLCSTSSYALLLAEEVQKRGLRDKIKLRKGVIGSERWGDLMRDRICKELSIELFDIYGLTEVYGPGIAIDCPEHSGMHYWDDYLYFEIIDSRTGEVLPEGEYGELVITTLCKEAAPLIRYRTHDLTRILPGHCPCGSKHPRIDRIMGRTDDMIKVKGVNIYPSQIENLLEEIKGVSSEYLIEISHVNGKDEMTLRVERLESLPQDEVEHSIRKHFKDRIGISITAETVTIGSLPRSEKKSKRIYDYRCQ